MLHLKLQILLLKINFEIQKLKIQKTGELNFLMTELSKLLQPEFLVQMYQMLRSFVEKGIHLKENWFMVG